MSTSGMVYDMARHWWVFLIRGVAAVLFGIAALVWPALTIFILVILFGAYVLVDGLFSTVAAFRGGQGVRWSMLAWGIIGVAAGVVAFLWPGLTALALVLLIGAWAIVNGVIQLIASIALRQEIQGEWMLAIGGVLSIAVGVVLREDHGWHSFCLHPPNTLQRFRVG